jgi:hypothetical protein
MSRYLSSRLDRLERGQPELNSDRPSPNFFDLLLGVVVGSVTPADLRPADQELVERFFDAGKLAVFDGAAACYARR